MIVLRAVRAVGLFLYGFVVGDDPVVAVVMIGSLVVSAALVARGVNPWWVVPPVAVAMTGLNLWRNRPMA